MHPFESHPVPFFACPGRALCTPPPPSSPTRPGHLFPCAISALLLLSGCGVRSLGPSIQNVEIGPYAQLSVYMTAADLTQAADKPIDVSPRDNELELPIGERSHH